MTSQYRHRRSSNPSVAFANPLEPGELAVNTANRQLAAGDAASGTIGVPLNLLAIRIFDVRAIYAIGDMVVSGNAIYRAKAANGPGAFSAAQWDAISNVAGKAAVYTDGSAPMTAQLTLIAPPVAATDAAAKSYVDSTAASAASTKVAKAGDTMTGNLSITLASASINLTKTASGQNAAINGFLNATPRWVMNLGDAAAESGANAGSDLGIVRYGDAGGYLGTPLIITRSSGDAKFGAGLTVSNTANGSLPGNGNAILGFEVQNLGSAAGAMIFSSVNTSWNANWNRNSAGQVHTFTISGGGWVGSISTTATATTYSTTSSGELKEDLRSFDAGLIVDQTNVYDFKWKDSSERAYGVIAQHAVEVYPLAVTHHVDDERDWWGVDYSKYVPVLLQELKALRARVATLEGGVTPKTAPP